ncbi:alpha/beta hydrolase [Desulfosarcina widdelii]|uniref:Alpha/beta hydrolase n=1 Tax=Desulfosarcina widdelii TaxID=947919 RepID=A0A5K7ZBC4_9BACT|nr:alpha/beta fold hydrolase [Desulfosarcina widdelii]BBO77021.1 alpha/beta hydrolase [Desulfosarcina widdelii]
MAEKITFASACGNLEGLLDVGTPQKGAVITHPHPLYGGDMFNPVVEAIETAYRKAGFSTLRFNLRGTGNSAGTHDNGIGEREDVAAAVAYLKSEGVESIHLSGYSFGAWVNAMAVQNGLAVDGMTMVAPPVAFIDFADGIRLPGLTKVVAGSQDEFAPPYLIRPLLVNWNRGAEMEIIEGADHFYFAYLDDVTRLLLVS